MMVEIDCREVTDLDLSQYESIEMNRGTVYYSPAEQRPAVVVKEHPDGKVSVTTDNMEVITQVAREGDVVDLHAK